MRRSNHIVPVWFVNDLPEEAVSAVNAILGNHLGIYCQAISPVLSQIVLSTALHQHQYICAHMHVPGHAVLQNRSGRSAQAVIGRFSMLMRSLSFAYVGGIAKSAGATVGKLRHPLCQDIHAQSIKGAYLERLCREHP